MSMLIFWSLPVLGKQGESPSREVSAATCKLYVEFPQDENTSPRFNNDIYRTLESKGYEVHKVGRLSDYRVGGAHRELSNSKDLVISWIGQFYGDPQEQCHINVWIASNEKIETSERETGVCGDYEFDVQEAFTRAIGKLKSCNPAVAGNRGSRTQTANLQTNAMK
jgi:hypothetical protein